MDNCRSDFWRVSIIAAGVVFGAIVSTASGQSNAPVTTGALPLTEPIVVAPSNVVAQFAAARDAVALETAFDRVQQVMSDQRARDLEALQSSHRLTFVVVGVFAGVAFLGLLFFCVYLVRTMNRRTELALARPPNWPMTGEYGGATFDAEDTALMTVNPAVQSSRRFLGAIDRLEKRIQELEAAAAVTPFAGVEIPVPAAEPAPDPQLAQRVMRAALLVGKGQTLLNLERYDEAQACLDEAIAADPNNAEAFVKKGTILERLGKIDEAIDQYDRAITLNGSLTTAYLCKGSIYNRLERYGEALECYEQALRAQQQPSSP